MNKPTAGEAPTATYVAREAEVPNANWATGGDVAGLCAPGIGINIGGGAISGGPQQFTLKDQDDAVRVPQVSGPIGGNGLGAGVAGKATTPIDVIVNDPSGNGDFTSAGTANLQTLAAGWVETAV